MGIGVSTETSGIFIDWLNNVFDRCNTEERQVISTVCWAIWKCRNELVWNQRGMEVAEVIVSANTALNQWKSAQDRSFSTSLSYLYSGDGEEHWRTPNVNKIKVNTDAATFAESKFFSYSFVARNHAGNLIEARASCRYGSVAPEIAEAIGLREALSWIKDQGLHQVEMETDCLVAVQAIRCSCAMLSYFGRVIEECKRLLASLKESNVSMKFVTRSANKVAHYLVKPTSVISDRVLRVSNAPSEFINVLSNDLII